MSRISVLCDVTQGSEREKSTTDQSSQSGASKPPPKKNTFQHRVLPRALLLFAATPRLDVCHVTACSQVTLRKSALI